jgi:hypothetical protein
MRGIAGEPEGFNPVTHLYQNTIGTGPYGVGGGGMGSFRDARLFVDSFNEVRELLFGGEPTDAEEQFERIVSTWTDEGATQRTRRAQDIYVGSTSQ